MFQKIFKTSAFVSVSECSIHGIGLGIFDQLDIEDIKIDVRILLNENSIILNFLINVFPAIGRPLVWNRKQNTGIACFVYLLPSIRRDGVIACKDVSRTDNQTVEITG